MTHMGGIHHSVSANYPSFHSSNRLLSLLWVQLHQGDTKTVHVQALSFIYFLYVF